jgi:hypothetical protein
LRPRLIWRSIHGNAAGFRVFKALGMIAAIMVTDWIVEPIAYFPILGTSGTYMSWLAAITQICRARFRAGAGSCRVKEGTPEGD